MRGDKGHEQSKEKSQEARSGDARRENQVESQVERPIKV
jgi:hypothetical protein